MAFKPSISASHLTKSASWFKDDDSTLLDDIDHEVQVLRGYHDWDEWRRDIQTHVDVIIWKYMWSDDPPNELLPCPTVPSVHQFNEHARDVSELTQDEFQLYHNQNKLYFSKKEAYDRQSALVQKAKGLVLRTVSPEMAKLLDQKESLRKWMSLLEQSTAPTLQQRVQIERASYEEVLEKLDLDSQQVDWAYEWYNSINRCHKLNMPETHCGTWLRDIADCILPYSTRLYERFQQGAARLDLAAIEWRREAEKAIDCRDAPASANRGELMKSKSDCSRSENYNTPFDVDRESDGDDGDDERIWTFLEVYREIRDIDLSAGREGNRPGKVTSLTESPQCPVCGLNGHDLRHCWYTFEARRPEGALLSKSRLRRVDKILKMDQGLAQRVADINDGFISGRFYQRQMMLRNPSAW